MNILKRIPIHFKGELHDVRLVNFTVDPDEVRLHVPPSVKVRDFNGRAMISMVDVKLRNMRPTTTPFIRFNYRHIAFRLLVDDSHYTDGANKGIFFFRSFTNRPLIAFGGQLLTDYRLKNARIEETENKVDVSRKGQHVTYTLDGSPAAVNDELMATIGALDRAYSVLGNAARVTLIQREKWPIQPVHCTGFENTFFKSASFEGAFRVMETIYYEWLPPKAINV